MEIRGHRLKSGYAYLGSKGLIHGRAWLGEAMDITTKEAWDRYKPQHCVDEAMPTPTASRRIFALPLAQVEKAHRPIDYKHPRGAIGAVRFRGKR